MWALARPQRALCRQPINLPLRCSLSSAHHPPLLTAPLAPPPRPLPKQLPLTLACHAQPIGHGLRELGGVGAQPPARRAELRRQVAVHIGAGVPGAVLGGEGYQLLEVSLGGGGLWGGEQTGRSRVGW